MKGSQRRWLLIICTCCFALVALLMWLAPKPSVSKSVSDQIRIGMTRFEVEALIGVPPGDYTIRKKFYEPWGWNGAWSANLQAMTWVTDDGAILVVLEADETVVLHWFQSMENAPRRTFVECLQRLIEGRKQRPN